MKRKRALRFLVNGLWMVGCCILSPWTMAEGQEVRRIAPDRFPEMRLEHGQRQERMSSAPPALDLDRPLASCYASSSRAACMRTLTSDARRLLGRLLDLIQTRWQLAPDVSEFHRQAWNRSLREADRRFASMREEECGLLALSEESNETELYVVRLSCEIRRTLERVEGLRARYGIPAEEVRALLR